MLQLCGTIMIPEITAHFRKVIFTYTYILEIRDIIYIMNNRQCCTVQTCNSNTKENTHDQPGLYSELQDNLDYLVWPSKEQINNILENGRLNKSKYTTKNRSRCWGDGS